MPIILIFAVVLLYARSNRMYLKFSGRDLHRVRQYAPEIEIASRESGIPESIIAGVILIESRGYANAKGRTNDFGLMQLTLPAVTDLGLKTIPIEPALNVLTGARFLALQLSRMGGNMFDALRAYNAGASGAKRNRKQSAGYAHRVLFWSLRVL